ncbi:MAG: FAD-binding oxidoreductase [Actinobacteria bacterium]|nr:FAD-binding oxidoreductase [Actinomycetota bacterium]
MDSLVKELRQKNIDFVSNNLFDRLTYANDASHYLLTPSLITKPKSAEDLSNIFRIVNSNHIGVTFRSGGTSLSGQGVSDGLLVDTRRNFKNIEVLDDGEKVRVEPGLTVNRVNASLRKYGKKLGPDPASEIACTIGGVVANNSSGMSCGTIFNTYKTLSSLKFVLSSGTLIDSKDIDADELLRIKEPLIYEGLINLRKRIIEKPYLVEKINIAYSIKNTMGYGLNSFVDFEKPIDILTHLLVGSEGTLGFIAEATFNTIDLLNENATTLLLFDDLKDATKSLPLLKESNANVIELLDISSLKVAKREHMADLVLKDLTFANNAALLVEYQAKTKNELEELTNLALKTFKEIGQSHAIFHKDPEVRNQLWHARKGLYAAVAGNRAKGTTALLEDISVPMQNLHETTMHLSQLLNKHKYLDSVIFGHAKDGNLHFLLNEKFNDENHLQRYIDFTNDLVELVLSQDGSLKAEHGTGRIMAPFVKKQFGEELYQIMVDLKKLIDPKNLLNPGVIINENEKIYIENLKTQNSIDQEVDKCVECGYCETVCPSKDVTLTPRQRITLRRAEVEALKTNDQETLDAIKENYDYQAIDTCAVDGMCQTACPVHINTGDLVKRLRSENQSGVSQYLGFIASKNWSKTTNLLSKLLTLAKKLPSSLVIPVNKIARQIGGNNSLPLWNKELPNGGRPRVGKSINNPDLLYFPSCTSSLYGEDSTIQSFLSLCNKAGLNVLIPEDIDQLCCATPWSSKGLTQGFEEMALKTSTSILKHLKDPAVEVVSDASSCSQGLQNLLKDTSVSTKDLVQFIAESVLPKLEINRKVSTLALHPTCSGVEMGTNKFLNQIALSIADEVITPLDWSCCGFAGDRGLLHPELTESATEKEAQEIKNQEIQYFASTNKPCQIALSKATGKKYVHIVELLDELSR